MRWPDLSVGSRIHAGIRHRFGYPRRSALPWQRFAMAMTAHKTAHPASGENVRSQRLTMDRPESTCRADVTCLIFT